MDPQKEIFLKKYLFEPNHYYKYGDIEKFGFVAIIVCEKRINHRDGSTTLSFTITDLKVEKFNSGCIAFLNRLIPDNKFYINRFESEGYETIDTWYYTIDAENEVDSPYLKQ